MTAPSLTAPSDPSGLGGSRISRDETFAPDVVEFYEYPSSIGFDAIESAWRTAPRRPRTLVMSITLYRQREGRIEVRVRLYVEPSEALP